MTAQRTQHQGNSRHSVIVPYRIGLLLDRKDQAHRDLHDGLVLAIEEARVQGELDRDIKVEVRETAGAPEGSVLDAIGDWQELTRDGMLMAVVGPFEADNGSALTEAIDAAGLPTITYSASDDYSGRFVFQLPFGHAADVIHRLLDHAAAASAQRPVLVHEAQSRGRLLAAEFRRVAWQRRMARVDTLECDASLSANLRRLLPDAVLYLGGWNHEVVDRACKAAGISPLRLTGSEIIHAHSVLGRATTLEGWIGTSLVDPANRAFLKFVRAFETRYRRRADHAYAAVGYDIGRILSLVLSVVRPPSPEGVRAGLDRLRMVPSASGAAGTVISFAPYDHRGFKGDPLVLSCVRNHTLVPLNGKSVQR